MKNSINRKKIALLLPHTDTTLEYDLKRILPHSISIHSERMWLEEVTVESEKKMLKEEVPRAIEYLRSVQPDIGIFGCTSAGSIYGTDGDAEIKRKIATFLRCKSLTAFSAVIECLQHLQPKKLAVISPYIDELHTHISDELENIGFHITYSKGFGLQSDADIGHVEPQEIINFIQEDREEIEKADCLFISCTNFRAFECKESLEALLNIEVVTSNYAIFKQIFDYLGKH
ncbi:maleate cis-trans isomerase family protein [Virgibacillus sp. W0430]|uniref:maleate cis-trans isomerase family protein n=1 Tax=Virgibacillus sp. W0430 TaxID=3391580 RepID=UPI003F4724A3